MDMYKLKFTRLQNEIVRLLCIKSGESLNQRNVAKLLKVSPTAVAKSLKDIEKEGLVIIEKNGNMNLSLIQLSRQNHKAVTFKRFENLKMLYESNLIEYLFESFPGSKIVLFGSYSLGEDTTKSDIDIAIIGSKAKDMDLIKYNKLLEREININYYTDLKEINKNLRENIMNGVVLH